MKDSSTEGKLGLQPRGSRMKMPEVLSNLRQKLYQKAKQEPKFRFYSLMNQIYRDETLETAWQMVRRNKGAAGIDGISIKDVEDSGVREFLLDIKESLQGKKYKAQPVRRVYIPKPNGKLRPLGIPTVRDRVVQAAVLLIIEPIFEADFLDCSYGFRPGKSAHAALEKTKEYIKEGYQSIQDVDIKGYFDNIPHDKLLECIKMRITDGGVLKLIRMWLRAPIVEDTGKGGAAKRNTKGTPQGGVISPLLANIYLHWFDKLFEKDKGKTAKLVRYADDLIILAKYQSTELIEYVRSQLEDWLGLELNKEKTSVVELKEEKEELNFLGYTFKLCRDLKGRPWKYVNLEPSKASVRRACRVIKSKTTSKMCYKPIPDVIEGINLYLQHWKPYFSCGYPRKQFRKINSYAIFRITKHLRRRSQRPFKPSPGVTYYEQIHKLGFCPL